jgi:alpha-tubulin suppressor-like RCC1 family protein
MNGSIGGDGSSSDLIYLTPSLSFEGGIGKSNYHIISVTNADDNTGNGGSGNGGKGGSGTVIIKYIPKYNYKLELENEITPVLLDEYHNYILFNINYDINNYKIKFPEEYGTFNADVLVVGGNSLDNNGCNIGGGEVIYSNIELSSNIEYNINIGKNHIFKGFKSEFYNITAYGVQSNSNINIDKFGFINDNNSRITIDNNIYLENYSSEKYQTNDGISLYSIFPDSNLGYYNNSKIYFGISDYLGNVNNIPVNYSINKSMYVYGDNNYGQLGLGSTVNWQDTQTELKYFKDNNINIVKIFSHKNRSELNNNFFIDNNGTVYACGYNSYGQLGIGSSDNKNIPTKISVFKNENNEEITKPIIIKIVNSDYATLFLDNNGNVYGCGKDNSVFTEKLSHVNFKTYPTLLSPEINNIIDIVFTDYGFLLLNNNGIVYAIGGNSARMGLGSNTTNTYFVNSITDHEIKVFLRKDKTEIIQRPYITKIYGHYNTIFFIDNNGDVYACGSNSEGQMGIGSDTSVIYNPIKIEQIFTDKIVDISFNDLSTLFLDNNGDVYGCGKNTLYWLGIGGISAKNDPVKIEVFRDENNGTIEKPKIVKVVMPVSKYNNNYNSVAFFHDNNGNVYVSGYNVYNYYKNLVKYDMAYTQQPIKTNLRNIIDIETGVFIQYDSMVLNDTISSNPVVLVKYKNSRIDIVSSFSSEINYSAYNNIYPLLSNNNLVTNITNKNTSIDINLDNDLFTILIKIQIKTSERYRIFNIKNIFIEINENNIYIYDNNSDLIEDISNLNIKFKWIDICITYSNNNLILYLGLEGKIVKIIETTKTMDNTIDNLVILNNSDFIFEDYSILCEDIKVYSSILSIDKIQKYIFGNKSLYLT